MAESDTLVLGLENGSSLAWSAPERYEQDLEKLARADGHHLYLVVVGPKLTPTALDALPHSSGWKLSMTYGAADGLKLCTITVPESALPGRKLSFDEVGRVLTLSPTTADGAQGRKITVAEVVRAALEVGPEKLEWTGGTASELFAFRVAYIGQSYGKEGSSKALQRLSRGHETVDKILSDTQDYSPDSAVGFITIDQHPMSVSASIGTNQDSNVQEAAGKIAAERFKDILLGTLSKETVDAAEAALITAFQPEWNILLKDFTQKERPALMKRLRDGGYTHLQIHIDLKDAHAMVKGPNGKLSDHHTWTFNLQTGALEDVGRGSWRRPNTMY
ncbi:hypothetical protein [Paenarthrobacter aromaticivorans]|uniref:hypothetical protein n=1 Tax=Paenarthrobacter aromaticivorans TaxID=2849150 RepID=UPI003A7F7B85